MAIFIIFLNFSGLRDISVNGRKSKLLQSQSMA